MTKSAKQYFDTALEMKHAATGEYRKLAEKARAEISAAKGDADLSPQGREKKAEQLKRKHGVEIMQWAHTYSQAVRSEMKKARIAAQKELDKAAPKVDPTKLERWEKEYRKVKTSLMLASSVDKAAKVMNDFIKTADEPGLKALLVDRYGDLAEQVLSVGSDPKVRAQMAYQFNSLQNEALTDAQVEARQVLEATEGFEQRNVFDKLVADNLTGLVGWEYGDYINDTTKFFSREENAEHMPDDYYDPELEKLDRDASTEARGRRVAAQKDVQALTDRELEIKHTKDRITLYAKDADGWDKFAEDVISEDVKARSLERAEKARAKMQEYQAKLAELES